MKKSTNILILTCITFVLMTISACNTVRVVNRASRVENCKFLGSADGFAFPGGSEVIGHGYGMALDQVKEKAKQMGGNVVLKTYVHSTSGGARVTGDVYYCDDTSGQ